MAEWTKVSRAADKALALLLPDKGPRSMEISTVYMCQKVDDDDQDTDNECDHVEDRVEKTEQCSAKTTIVRGVR